MNINIYMKKIASLLAAFALLFVSAGGTYAWFNDVVVTNFGYADQLTVSASLSNTGLNSTHNNIGGFTATGPTYADSLAQSGANTFSTSVAAAPCSLCSIGDDTTVLNSGVADQTTVSVAVANSGLNHSAWNFGGGLVTGGAAAISGSQSVGNVFTTKITR